MLSLARGSTVEKKRDDDGDGKKREECDETASRH